MVETTHILNHNTLQKAVELFLINAMRPFNFAVEAWCSLLDVDVDDVQVLHIPVELGAELWSVIRLNRLHAKG